jgi:hypothetical protein
MAHPVPDATAEGPVACGGQQQRTGAGARIHTTGHQGLPSGGDNSLLSKGFSEGQAAPAVGGSVLSGQLSRRDRLTLP